MRRGRRDEFAAHGWARQDVPDPQSDRRRSAPAGLVGARHGLRTTGCSPGTARSSRCAANGRDLGDPRLDLVEVEHDAEAQTVVVRRGDHLVLVNLGTQPWTLALEADNELVVVAAWDEAGTVLEAGSVTLPGAASAILGPT